MRNWGGEGANSSHENNNKRSERPTDPRGLANYIFRHFPGARPYAHVLQELVKHAEAGGQYSLRGLNDIANSFETEELGQQLRQAQHQTGQNLPPEEHIAPPSSNPFEAYIGTTAVTNTQDMVHLVTPPSLDEFITTEATSAFGSGWEN